MINKKVSQIKKDPMESKIATRAECRNYGSKSKVNSNPTDQAQPSTMEAVKIIVKRNPIEPMQWRSIAQT